MKLKRVLLFVLFTYQFIFSADLKEELAAVIVQGLHSGEMNPVHRGESESLNTLFTKALNRSEDPQVLRKELFDALYSNSTALYEDSNDSRRYRGRRAKIFAAIALTSDEESYETFLDYARHSLMEEDRIEELLETQYCALLFLDIFIQLRENPEAKISFEGISQFVAREKECFSEEFYMSSVKITGAEK